MPVTSDSRPEPFLVGQPIWYLQCRNAEVRWREGTSEIDPTDEKSDKEMEIRRAEFDVEEKGRSAVKFRWRRCPRRLMLKAAVCHHPRWRRVALVCGAGLGKSTNIDWMEASINRMNNGRGGMLAVATTVSELAKINSERDIENWLIDESRNTGQGDSTFAVRRALDLGRVTFLLDSLDQVSDVGKAMEGLKKLATGRFKNCRIWISGRPYAFRGNSEKSLREFVSNDEEWRFMRIGPLDEPECRQLLELSREHGRNVK